MSEKNWIVSEGERDGKVLVFRSIEGLPAGAVMAACPFLLTIVWEYDADASGMPDAQAGQAIDRFEEALSVLDRDGFAVLALVMTGDGQKVWYWYVHDPDAWIQKFNAALDGHGAYPIDIECDDDPEWSLFKGFLEDFDAA